MEENKYVYKILQLLLVETIINFKEGTIKLPFYIEPITLPFHRDYILPHLHSYRIITNFERYVKDVYGLTDNEIEYLRDVYIEKLVEIIKNDVYGG
jgi:hypothetical protein